MHGGGKRPSTQLDSWIIEAEERLNATRIRGSFIDKRYNRAADEAEYVIAFVCVFMLIVIIEKQKIYSRRYSRIS